MLFNSKTLWRFITKLFKSMTFFHYYDQFYLCHSICNSSRGKISYNNNNKNSYVFQAIKFSRACCCYCLSFQLFLYHFDIFPLSAACVMLNDSCLRLFLLRTNFMLIYQSYSSKDFPVKTSDLRHC